MKVQQGSRKEYIHRINRVVDHVEANIEEDHSLQNLAEVANFSPYHFHRIFRALTGETLNTFVKRLRLQKAGSMLLSDYERPVEEISSLCGFSSMPVFCRAFKEHYGKSTSEFRSYHETKDRKNGQNNSKRSQSLPESSSYFSDDMFHQKNKVAMEANFKVKYMPGMDLIYVRHTGPYEQIGKAYEKLYRWAGPRGLVSGPGTKTMTVYHDDPKIVDEDKVRQSACIVVEGEVRTEGEVGKMHIPSGQYAVGSFVITPDKFGEAWDSVCRWLADNGYQPTDGYPYEYYPMEHEEGPPPVFTVDICVPVKPL